MPIKVTCPKCQGVLHAPDDAGGKRGKCPTCGTVLAIPAIEAASNDDLPFADPPPRTLPPRPANTGSAQPLGGTAMDADARRSSFGSLSDPPADPIPRASASKLPPSFGSNEPKKPADPFARKAPKAADPAPATDSEARNYRRLRRGLATAGFGYTLILLGVIGFLAVPLLPQAGVAVPDKTPGYLGQAEVSSRTEIHAAASVVPALLGVLFVLLGRSGAGSAPRGSGARGTFKLATLFSLVAAAGLVAWAVPTAMAAQNGVLPPDMLVPDDPSGYAQRGGLGVAAVFAPLAELLFWFGLGRLGSGLGDARATGRVTRYAFYAAALAAVAGLTAFGLHFYGADAKRLIATHVEPQLTKLGPVRPFLFEIKTVVVAVSAWLLASRAIGAARRAVRVWLERHT